IKGSLWNTEISITNKFKKVTSPLGRVKTSYFNEKGQITELHNNDFFPAYISYDANGRVSRIEQGERSITYIYDVNGNVKEVGGTGALFQTFNTDIFGRITSKYDGSGNGVHFSYDGEGNLKSIENMKN